MTDIISQSIQDYLKNIYELNESGVSASTKELAIRLSIAPASVTGMLQKLASQRPPLVNYKKHQGVTLTKSGEKAALEVIRHHRLIEAWLVQTLGYSWDEVHEEAEKLEHVISEDFERRIAAAMGHPIRDPHGELIPTEDLKMPFEDSTPLSALRNGYAGSIQCVKSADNELLQYLENLGLTPGADIYVKDYSQYDQNLTIQVGKKSMVLGLNITSKIYIKESKQKGS